MHNKLPGGLSISCDFQGWLNGKGFAYLPKCCTMQTTRIQQDMLPSFNLFKT